MTLLAVLIGGALGTGLRLALDLALPHDTAGFPVSTLVINVVGSFALGLLVARLPEATPGWMRAGLAPGLLGSFTTFSALAVSLIAMTEAGEPLLAAMYLVASVVLGLGAAFAGLALRPRGTDVAPIGVEE